MNQTKTQFIEGVKLALDVIWGHRLRSALVILGVAVAVATLMGMVTILSGLSNKTWRKSGISGNPAAFRPRLFPYENPALRWLRINVHQENSRWT